MDFERFSRQLDKTLREVSIQIQRELAEHDLFRDLKLSRPLNLKVPPGGPAVDYAGFKQLLSMAAVDRQYPRATPDRIDLGPLHHYMEKLWGYTERTGVEYGRAAVLNLRDGSLQLGEARPGDGGACTTIIRVPLDGFHYFVSDMHTHPRDPARRAPHNTRLHFSQQDFVNFVQTEPLIASFVISGPEIALILKTSSVMRGMNEQLARKRLGALLEEKFRGNANYEHETWNFTRFAALELGCSLYRNHKDAPGLLIKVPVVEP